MSEKMYCVLCKSRKLRKNGFARNTGKQQYICKNCGSTRVRPVAAYPRHYHNRQDAKNTDILEAVKRTVKATVTIYNAYTWHDKFTLAGIMAAEYNVPIGEINRMIDRVLRANDVELVL